MVNKLYEVKIFHQRNSPIKNTFEYKGIFVLNDLQKPYIPPFLLKPFYSINSNKKQKEAINEILKKQNYSRPDKIIMLVQPKILGYAFNPITIYWCFDKEDNNYCIVVEVHNTYKESHKYVLENKPGRKLTTQKKFYVSPFYPESGIYKMSLPFPEDNLQIVITYKTKDQAAFVATMKGEGVALNTISLLKVYMRRPIDVFRVPILIRYQGIKLWLKKVPIVKRVLHEE